MRVERGDDRRKNSKIVTILLIVGIAAVTYGAVVGGLALFGK